MPDYQLVSADSHVEVPPNLWTHRLPARLRDKAPRVVKLPDGGDGLDLGQGAPARGISIGIQAGVPYRKIVRGGLRWDSSAPGAGGGEQRVREQERDGIDGEVLFCSVASELAKRSTDREVVVESMKAYNDWVLDDFNAAAPERLFALPVMPNTGIEDALAELERVERKLRAFRAVQLLAFPSGGTDLGADDERFWAAATDLGITLTCHHNIGAAEQMRQPKILGDDNEDLNFFAFLLTCDLPVPTLPIFTLLQIMMGGVLDRHPKLRFHFAETYIGWIPFWLEQMEDRYDRHRFWIDVDLPRRPAQYLRQHFHFTFQEDHVGVKLRDEIGVDNICWASDMPHPVSDWPWSPETAARQFRGLPNDERRKIQALNVLEWLRVITPEEKEKRAQEPVVDRAPAELPPRGARRLGTA